MELYTAKEVMDFWDAHAAQEAKAERAEIERIRKDIDTACKYFNDAVVRYRKNKTRSRSKAKAAADPFADLADYSSKTEIQDAFGWEFISEKEMDRLCNLWDLREQNKNKTVLEDRVTEIMEQAIRGVGEAYIERLLDYDEKRKKMYKEAERVARENLSRANQRKNEAH